MLLLMWSAFSTLPSARQQPQLLQQQGAGFPPKEIAPSTLSVTDGLQTHNRKTLAGLEFQRRTELVTALVAL